MQIEELGTLLDYHYWARDRVLAAVAPLTPEQFTRDLGNSFKSVRDTLTHIYFAEWIWYSRWNGTSPSGFPSVEAFPDVAAIAKVWKDQEARTRHYVMTVGGTDPDKMFDYTLMNGQPGRSSFQQMFQQVVNHGSYHRGQVTMMLRQLGVAPPASQDMITFFRERGN